MALNEAANSRQDQGTRPDQDIRAKMDRFFRKMRDLSLERQIEELQNIVVAQSQAIDSLLPRLVVLDKTYDPVQHLTWPLVERGRQLAERILQERPDAGTDREEDQPMDQRQMG